MKTKKKRNSLLTLLLSCTLYSSLILTAPQYVECKEPNADEFLDLRTIPNDPVDSKDILTPPPLVLPFYDSIAQVHTFQFCYLRERGLYLQPFTSELVLSVTLRC